MRPSAEIGSEKITRSMRVRRANSTRSSTVPSFCWPATTVGERSSPRSSNTPTMRTSESRLRRASDLISASPLLVGADHDGAAVEPALARPAPHQQEQRAAEADQRDQADDVEGAEPDARELLADLGEEGRADDQQEHHRPGGGEPEVLLLVAAERLHLVDVGGLEREHRQHGDAEDRADIVPLEAVDRNDVADVDRECRPARPARTRSCARCRRARSATRRPRSAARRPSSAAGDSGLRALGAPIGVPRSRSRRPHSSCLRASKFEHVVPDSRTRDGAWSRRVRPTRGW